MRVNVMMIYYFLVFNRPTAGYKGARKKASLNFHPIVIKLSLTAAKLAA